MVWSGYTKLLPGVNTHLCVWVCVWVWLALLRTSVAQDVFLFCTQGKLMIHHQLDHILKKKRIKKVITVGSISGIKC